VDGTGKKAFMWFYILNHFRISWKRLDSKLSSSNADKLNIFHRVVDIFNCVFNKHVSIRVTDPFGLKYRRLDMELELMYSFNKVHPISSHPRPVFFTYRIVNNKTQPMMSLLGNSFESWQLKVLQFFFFFWH
jgi:hypothetical protein